jgi:predicted dehydrogenase
MMAKRRVQPQADDYAVSKPTPNANIPAPDLPYRPPRPECYRAQIGLIGCGGVTQFHLNAYRRAGYRVVGFMDVDAERAEQRRNRYYPSATVYPTATELLARRDIDVVDIATHPEARLSLIRDAIGAGKHILSQKPFVTDLAVGRKLVAAAERRGVKLAVNQNGRWAPHVSYARQAIAAGLLGDVTSVDLAIHWDHNWCAGTSLDQICHLVLFDFAIHWFDMVHCYFAGRQATSVFASVRPTKKQRTQAPLLAQVLIEYPNAQASLAFRADTPYGPQDRSVIVGTQGTLVAHGPNLNEQSVRLYSAQGVAAPRLKTRWFDDGFDGTMSELLCAIEEQREPANSARDNLKSLELCFAALASAKSGRPVKPGEATSS